MISCHLLDFAAVPFLFRMLAFFHLIEKLKTTKRTGWIENKVNSPESIADHMYRMALMALSMPNSDGINKQRCVYMALVHDLVEAIAGDISPAMNVSKHDKHKLESDAMTQICALLDSENATLIRELWDEYENATSPEAILVKDFDKFEMIVQAFEFEDRQAGLDLESFFESTRGKFQTDYVKGLAEQLYKERMLRHQK